jgi:hypothetical protein
LASANIRAENIAIEPIVVPELKLRNEQRQIFAAHFVERADNAALKDAPPRPIVGTITLWACPANICWGFVYADAALNDRYWPLATVLECSLVGRY